MQDSRGNFVFAWAFGGKMMKLLEKALPKDEEIVAEYGSFFRICHSQVLPGFGCR